METADERPATPSAHRWVVICDSGFLPPRGGGEKEHAGFVNFAFATGRLAALVVPTEQPLDTSAYEAVIGSTPLLAIPRKLSPLRLLHPRYPYVVASRPYPQDLAARVQAAAPAATGIVTFSYKSHLIGERLALALELPMVVRQHNREGAYHRALAAGLSGPRKVVMTWEGRRIERDERDFDRSPLVTAVADISADDAAARRAAGAPHVIHVPPFAFGADMAETPEHQNHLDATNHNVLFLGALDIATNRSALDWFITQVWPRVRAGSADATLTVVGSRPPADLREQLARIPSTELCADVPDIGPYLRAAAIAVNPAVTGSGVNIKLVDYLQAGVPVVSTSLATRGLDLRPGVDLEISDDPDSFAAAVLSLLADRDRADRLARSGRTRVAELLDPHRNLQRIDDAFDAANRTPESSADG